MVMEHFDGILFHKSGPANSNQSISTVVFVVSVSAPAWSGQSLQLAQDESQHIADKYGLNGLGRNYDTC